MSAQRKWPRRKIPSKRRLIARFFMGRPIAFEMIQERSGILERMKPHVYHPHAYYIVMKPL